MGKKSRRNKKYSKPDPLGEGLRRFGENHRREAMRETFSELNRFDHLNLNEQKTTIRGLVQEMGTDLAINDADPTGNGDQSPIATEEQRDSARSLYAIGGDIHQHLVDQALADFAMACLMGGLKAVRECIENAKNPQEYPPRTKELKVLLETRETSLRLSPLLLMVSAGKNIGVEAFRKYQVEAAKVLLQAGANPYAQDVFGKTVCHYGGGAFATDMTLQIVDMCIRACESYEFYGKDAELHGLNKTEMNGIVGVVGGFNPDTDRRSFWYRKEGAMKEVWVKVINLKLLQDQKPSSTKPLTDVQDRLGSVALHEVLMQDRADVASFLLEIHSASIHIEDADGVSPLSMSIGGSFMAHRVSKMISDVTRKEGKKNSRKIVCGHCQTFLGKTGGLQCIKCKSVSYCNADCQKAHWENGHREECKRLRSVAKGVKLRKPKEDHYMHTVSFSNFRAQNQGSYRCPDGVPPGEMFVIKVQGGGDMMPIMVYDESRTCQFNINPGEPGFREVVTEIRKEPTWQGRKTFMKASFEDGDCTVYPATAGVKAKYSW